MIYISFFKNGKFVAGNCQPKADPPWAEKLQNSMLIIRLLRVGKKHKPYFRLVLIEKGKRPGKYKENLGFYTPGAGDKKLQNIEAEKIKYWISKGAQMTPTVNNLLVGAKVIEGEKIAIKISKGKKSAPVGGSAEGGKGEVKSEEAKKTEPAAAKAEEPKIETPAA